MAYYLIDTDAGEIIDADLIVTLINGEARRLADAVNERMSSYDEDYDTALEALEGNYSRALIEEAAHDAMLLIKEQLDSGAVRYKVGLNQMVSIINQANAAR